MSFSEALRNSRHVQTEFILENDFSARARDRPHLIWIFFIICSCSSFVTMESESNMYVFPSGARIGSIIFLTTTCAIWFAHILHVYKSFRISALLMSFSSGMCISIFIN